jgi:hypothetical protein
VEESLEGEAIPVVGVVEGIEAVAAEQVLALEQRDAPVAVCLAEEGVR